MTELREKRFFVVAMLATREINSGDGVIIQSKTVPGAVWATSQRVAEEFGIKKAFEVYPIEEGWGKHTVASIDATENALGRGAWTE